MTSARRTGPALEATYRFLLWLVAAVEKFPRRQKFLLGDRIQATGLEVLERLIEATYTRSRRDTLAEANLGIEKLRFVLRLSCRCPAGEAASDQAGAWITHVEQAVSWGLRHLPRRTTSHKDLAGSQWMEESPPPLGRVAYRALSVGNIQTLCQCVAFELG